MKPFLYCFLGIILSISFTQNVFSKEVKLNIAYSANIAGYLEPCGCAGPAEEMLGGMQKRQAVLNQLTSDQGDALIVDSGDLFFGESIVKESTIPAVRLKAEAISKILVISGIHAINVGELDLAMGLDFLRHLEKTYQLPLISANLVNRSGERLFPPYLITNISGVKVGIFGIMDNSKQLINSLKSCVGQEIQIQDAVEAAQLAVNELRERVDVVVGLTHQHMGRNWVIARKVKGIDILVGGHHKQLVKIPYRANDTFIVQTSEKGNYQGWVKLIVNGADRNVKNQLIALGDNVEKDTQAENIIKQYNDNITALYVNTHKASSSPKVYRAKLCIDCHPDEYEVWRKTAHAHAFETLEKRSRQFDPECVSCHTTLFEQTNGFTMDRQQVELIDVQCDVCHGDSTAHLKDTDILPSGDPGKKTCITCHTPERSPGFRINYHKEWHKIRH